MSKRSCHHHILMVPLSQCRSHFPSPPDPHQPPEKPKSHRTGHGESTHGARPAPGTHHVSTPPRLCLQSQQQDQAHILHPVICRAAGPNPPGLGHLLPCSLAALSHQAAHRLSTRLLGWGAQANGSGQLWQTHLPTSACPSPVEQNADGFLLLFLSLHWSFVLALSSPCTAQKPHAIYRKKPWLAFLFTVPKHNENVKMLSHLTSATPVMHLLYFFL